MNARLTQRNLFLVFAYTCAYCERHVAEFSSREYLTRDHILPRSRGGLDTWQNTVAACSTCNYRKRNRTPNEAGMPLRHPPKTPSMQEVLALRALRQA